MKRLVLQSGFLALFSLLAVVFAVPGQRAAYALGPNIGPSGTTFVVLNTWQNSQVKLYEEIQGAYSATDIKITDTGWTSGCETDPSTCQSYLREGWVIKVGNELMCIQELKDGGYGQPDHMIVQRACGSKSEYHPANSPILGHTVTVDVFAQNVPGPEGLGGFEVALTMPPETQYIRAVSDTTWLDSTGRMDWCDPPTLIDGSWVFGCPTLGGYTPPGPTGTGLIAHVTVLPPQSLGSTTVSLAGSQLSDLEGNLLNPGATDIKISTISCPDADLDGKVSVGDLTKAAKSNGSRGEDSLATISPSSLSDSGQDVGIEGIDASATTLHVTSTTPFTVPPSIQIQIDSEQLRVTAIASGGTPGTLTVERGINGTTAAAHTAGTSIIIIGIGATDTTIPVSQVGLLQVNDTISIDAELMTVQAIDPVGLSITVTRANLQTAAKTHAPGAIIYRGTQPNMVNGTYNYTWPRDPNHDYKVSVGDITLMAKVSPMTCPAP